MVREIGFFGDLSLLWQILPREASVDDVTAFSGTVEFVEGQREAFIDIYIIHDDLPETIEVLYKSVTV